MQPGFAHDFWLQPSPYLAKSGERIDVSLFVGEEMKGETQPYIPGWFSDFRVKSASVEKPVNGDLGEDPAGYFKITPGLNVIGYRSTKDTVTFKVEKFNRYLRQEGLEWVIEARKRAGIENEPAPEHFSRCAKSLVFASGSPANEVDSKLGYTLELVAQKNPYLLKGGDSLPVQLFYLGKPIPEILVIAFTRENPTQKQVVRTDASGLVNIRLNAPGEWLIKAVHIIPVTNDPKAVWESFWASLTFQLLSSDKNAK